MLLVFDFPDWRIDPDCGWFVWRIRGLFDEALGIGGVGEIEDFLAGCVDCVGLAVVNLVRRHQSDACVMMIAIVPVDKASAEEFCVFDATEALRDRSKSLSRCYTLKLGIVPSTIREYVRRC